MSTVEFSEERMFEKMNPSRLVDNNYHVVKMTIKQGVFRHLEHGEFIIFVFISFLVIMVILVVAIAA